MDNGAYYEDQGMSGSTVIMIAVFVVLAIGAYMWWARSKYEDASDAAAAGPKAAPIQTSGLGALPMGNLNSTGMSPHLMPKLQTRPIEEAGALVPNDILKGESLISASELVRFPETISGSLRNANRQLRNEPPNPRTPVSIFNNSTIPGDYMRRPLDFDH